MLDFGCGFFFAESGVREKELIWHRFVIMDDSEVGVHVGKFVFLEVSGSGLSDDDSRKGKWGKCKEGETRVQNVFINHVWNKGNFYKQDIVQN